MSETQKVLGLIDGIEPTIKQVRGHRGIAAPVGGGDELGLPD